MGERRKLGFMARHLAGTLNQSVRDHCNASGDARDEIAEVIGISKTYLNNILEGVVGCPTDILVQLCRELDDRRAIVEVARSGGLLCIPFPRGADGIETSGIRELLSDFQGFADRILESREADSPGGSLISMSEAKEIEAKGRELESEVERLISMAKDEALRGGRVRSLSEADELEGRHHA